MAESNMAHFKMAAIIRLIRLNYFESEAEWSESVFEWIWEKITRCLNPRWQNSRCCHHQVEWKWMSEVFLCTMAESKMAHFKMAAIIRLIRVNYFQSEVEWSESVFEWIWEKITRCLNPGWQNSRWLPSSSWVIEWMSEVFLCTMAESKMAHFKMAAIIRLIRLNYFQSEVRVEWECFWVNLREDNKVSECKMAKFKMAAIIKLSENEWMKFSFVQNGWIQDGRIQDGWHHQIEWEWMSLSQIELVWVRVLCKMAESKMAEFKMADIIKLGKNEWVWVRLN